MKIGAPYRRLLYVRIRIEEVVSRLPATTHATAQSGVDQMGESKGRQRRFTHRAARLVVAGELLKRQYQVSLDETADFDLSGVSPETTTPFLIDVKGLWRKNPWLMHRRPPKPNLFYVLAFLPPDEPNQFFVMTQAEVDAAIESDLRRLGRPDDYPVTGVDWKLAQPHRDAWSKLPR